jgi:hypothetical protein
MPDAGAAELLQGYQFRPADLAVERRAPGISAFMRIRNGEEFLEATIRSHIDCFDEVVAVYNQCTDGTADILLRLRHEYPHKLRVIHYVDRVFPPGSEGHARTPASSPHSLVNYYNAALAATRFAVATKLDDDHLAIARSTKAVTDRLRQAGDTVDAMHCFSGLNLIRGPGGTLGVLASTPISGGGDIGFFPVRPDTYFVHDRRFERFQRGGLERRFCGFLYWHLKYLKAELGFANYEIDANPDSRYAKRRQALAGNPNAMISLHALPARLRPSWGEKLAAMLSAKHRLKLERNAAVASTFPDADALAALHRTTDARWLDAVLHPTAASTPGAPKAPT